MKNLIALTFILLALTAQAQITSTFDTDSDGWTFYNASFSSIAVTYNTASGNPGGYVSATYASNSGTTNANTNNNNQVWFAPAKFLGSHMVRSLGMNLKFDLQQSQAGTVSGFDVVIQNATNYIYFNLTVKPAIAPAWSSYSLSLDETLTWRYNSGGAIATRQQIIGILTNVTSLEIRGTYATNAAYTSGLDNVVLEQRTLAATPFVSSLSATSGKPGENITINGSGFDSTPSNNIVRFGAVAANIVNATATQLTVTIPDGAQYKKITITNTVTGLSGTSLQPFNPLFDGGGRIIRDSFKPRVDITPSTDVEGLSIADIDGDGWSDMAIASSTASKTISIYPNLGLGGEITSASFAPKVSVTIPGTSTNTTGLQFVDLDGDGKLDMITSNVLVTFGGAYFITFRNISTPGNFAFEAPEYWAGLTDDSYPSLITDLDGDGRPELIGGEGSYSTGALFWVTQNISSPGDIEFGASVGYFISGSFGFAGASIGDLDNDGKPEMLVTVGSSPTHGFFIFKNNSTPGTITLTSVGEIMTDNHALQIADFNLDGKNDLVFRYWGGTQDIRIRLNTNSGGALSLTDFDTEITLEGDLATYGGMSLADVNGDGKIDIAASDNTDVGVFENNYAGGTFDATAFTPAYEHPGVAGATYPTSPIVADLNGDGKPEIIVATTNATIRVSIFENKNVHAPVISVNTVSPLAAPVGATVTITGNNFSTILSENKVWFGAVEATVLSATENLITAKVPAGATYAPVSVTKSGLSSRYYLPFKTTFSSGVSFDNTHFAPPVNFTLTGATYNIEVGDLNNDGKVDIMASTGNIAYAFRNDFISGAISTTTLIPNDTLGPTAQLFGNPRLEDFDGDGKLDIASINTRIRRNISTSTDISFTPNINFAGAGNLAYADFNQDGKMDMAIANSGAAQLLLVENRTVPGDFITTGTFGSFSSTFAIGKSGVGGEITAADFDADGFPDVVTVNPTTDNISIFRNLGGKRITTTQFDTRVDVAVGDNPGRIYKGDFDNDGKIDLLFYHGAGTTPALLIVLQNISTVGNIAFNRIDLTNPSNTTVAHIADIDGDGKPEILTTSEAGNRFSIFKNIHTTGALTVASFAAPFNTTVTAPRGLATGDLNLDGKPEIIITRAANLLVVYENLIPSLSIAITQQPATPLNACEGSTATLSTDASGTTNITYQWQKFNSGNSLFENLTDNTTYAGVATKILSITNVTSAEGGNYRCLIKGDLAADVTTNVSNVVFNNLPSPPDVVSSGSCGSGSVTLTASGGSPGDYQWYTTSPLTLISGETNETYTTPVLSASTQYAVSVSGTFCTSLPANVTALVNPIPAKPAITSSIVAVGNAITICSTTALTLSAPTGFTDYLWSDGSITPQISVTTAGTYSVVVKDAQGCSSSASDGLTVTLVAAPCNNSAPVINTTSATTTIGGQISINLLDLISDADNNLVPSSLNVVVQPASGATTTINNGILLIDYTGTNFTGADQLTIQVCDVFGECVQQQLEIKVIGELVIYNAVSPNEDGLNDFFYLEFIDLLPNTQKNKVTIYNRWGSKVFEVENYNNTTNVFKGLNDNGNELPSGTYFFKIKFTSGRKPENGYLVLKR